MTHSFDQDARLLAALLKDPPVPARNFTAVLGPRRRNREHLEEASHLVGLSNTAGQTDEWLAQLHTPAGLDLAASSAASIALSILAEIELWQNQRLGAHPTARPLREVR
jgi:xanthine/CO dehydrogenase XdhC/CoxF family maturation factor